VGSNYKKSSLQIRDNCNLITDVFLTDVFLEKMDAIVYFLSWSTEMIVIILSSKNFGVTHFCKSTPVSASLDCKRLFSCLGDRCSN